MLPAAAAAVAIIAAGTFAAWLLAAGTGVVAAVVVAVAAVHTEIVVGPVAAGTPHWTGAADIAFDSVADGSADH